MSITEPGAEALATNPPVTSERVRSRLEAAGWRVGTDDDGDVYGFWGGHVFYFFLLGAQHDILQVRARYAGTVPLSEGATALRLLDDFSRARIWPKVYTRPDESQTCIFSEVSTDLGHGVADDQLDLLLRCGIFRALQFFDHVSESFPAWAPADRT